MGLTLFSERQLTFAPYLFAPTRRTVHADIHPAPRLSINLCPLWCFDSGCTPSGARFLAFVLSLPGQQLNHRHITQQGRLVHGSHSIVLRVIHLCAILDQELDDLGATAYYPLGQLQV